MKYLEFIKSHNRWVALIIIGWLFLMTADISKTYSLMVKSGREVHLSFIAFRSFTVWGWIALFVPLIWKLAQRFPLKKGHLIGSISLHLFGSLLFMPVHAILYRLTLELYYQEGINGELLAQSLQILMWLGLVSTFSYWLVVAVEHLISYYRQFRQQELKNTNLEAELTQTRMQVLNMQLHPHFLFNTLHNVNTLIYEDVDVAEKLLLKMKKLLDDSFNLPNQQEVRLSKEIEFISHYLDIEKTRFSDRLQVDWKIDPESMKAYVPHFILQPIVENAIRHGISKRIDPATIRIMVRKKGKKLQLVVEDQGPGLQNNPGSHKRNGSSKRRGMGLVNTRNRLENLYETHRFELSRSALGGLKVFIELPYRLRKYQMA